MNYVWQLGVFDPKQEYSVIPISNYLELRKSNTIDWVPNLENSALFLQVNGKELMAYEWNLGEIKYLIPQFLEAADRLKKGHFALIRSGVNDQPSVPYLLLNNIDSSKIEIWLFFIEDNKYNYLYPIPNVSGNPDDLYNYLSNNRGMILNNKESQNTSIYLAQFPSDLLLAGLQLEADLGYQLLQICEVEN